MTTLVLGVNELAYTNEDGDGDEGPVTTVTVATILEEKYGVMAHFYEKHENDVGEALVSSLEGALEDLYAGAPVHDPFAEADQTIQSAFRTFLLTGEIEQMGVPGVPTKAALDRRSSRFKKGRSKGPRPSFVDTALYELSMVAWTED